MSLLELIVLLLMVCYYYFILKSFVTFNLKKLNLILGDTANKIGTYSLALSAKHHGVQFYVAAPLTSVDLSLSSGNEIVIEERLPKELLNTCGGMGEQVAASEICIWNPAFDVTPANLISGIITEKVFFNLQYKRH